MDVFGEDVSGMSGKEFNEKYGVLVSLPFNFYDQDLVPDGYTVQDVIDDVLANLEK